MSLFNFFKEKPVLIKQRHVHCLFYSHIFTVYAIEELGLLNKTDIILELATQSHFSAALNPFNKYHKNLLGLLQDNVHLHQLGAKFKGICAPLVLAPHQGVALNHLLAALALVNTDSSPIEQAIVLVHINDAGLFSLAYPYMNSFSIVWDSADYPHAHLPALAQLLVDEQYLTEKNWGGFYLCNHHRRQLLNSDERTALLRQLMAQFPIATPSKGV